MVSQAVSSAPPVRKSRQINSTWFGYLLVAPPLILMGVLIFWPALQSIIQTLQIDDAGSGYSLARYIQFLNDPVSRSNLFFTFQITLLSVGILFIICFPVAIYLRFSRSRLAGWVQVLILFPLFVPGIILSYAMIRFLSTHGTLETLLHLVGLTGYRQAYLKPQGIIIGLVWEGLPFTTLILTAGLRQVDDALVESARDVGAGSWQIFWRILLPLVLRPAMIVLCLNFLGVFGAYTIPYLLGPAAPQMMAPFMQRTFNDVHDPLTAQVQAVVTFVVCSVVGILYVRTVSRQRAERN